MKSLANNTGCTSVCIATFSAPISHRQTRGVGKIGVLSTAGQYLVQFDGPLQEWFTAHA